MKMFPGQREEYIRRHAELWPELRQLLHEKGIRDYSIFLDPETDFLFGYLLIEDPALLDTLPELPVMKKWWAYMKEIMDSNPDNSPVSVNLEEVFFLP